MSDNTINPLSSPPPPQRGKSSNVDKPTGQPQVDKSFSQVQEDAQRERIRRQQQGPKRETEAVQNEPPKKKSSLFDLSKSQRRTQHGSGQKVAESGEQTKKSSGQPTGQSKPVGSSQQQQMQQMLGKEAVGREELLAEGFDKIEEAPEPTLKKSVATDKGEGRPELAALDQQGKQNPFSEASTKIDTKVGGDEAAKPSSTIQEIADKIVDKLQTVRTGDKIDTTITLKSPPVLEGASITVSSSATAKGEINLSFSNLSPEGKALIDQNSGSLRAALEKGGYTVHDIASVPREIEAAPISSEATSKDDRQREREGERGGGGRGDREGGEGGREQRRNR